MSEPNRNSLKLDIAGARSGAGDSTDKTTRETYKSIPEDDQIDYLRKDNSDEKSKPAVIMAHNGESSQNDGADEHMLKDEEKQVLAGKDEVQFISGNQNGEAKVDIGAVEQSFSGLTKEELMRYVNDPFWIRMRWFFFILFWLTWLGMLVGAVLIIINAPKCNAPTALKWWKQGPLITFNATMFTSGDVERAKHFKAQGVIYKLDGESTYDVRNPDVENVIKKIVEQYNQTSIKVILDLTPNYVTSNSTIYRNALINSTLRTPLVWVDKPTTPNNWVAKPPNRRSAWVQPPSGPVNTFVLSTFGDGLYDLRMNDPIVKTELRKTLKHLVDLGVSGFRFANAKHFIIDESLQDEVPIGSAGSEFDWEFWTHQHTTFVNGLGKLLNEYTLFVRNITNDDGFLSVNEDLEDRLERIKTEYNTFGIDAPMNGQFPFALAQKPYAANSSSLYARLKNIFDTTGNDTWLQWNFGSENLISLDPSAYYMFFMLLPGVPVQPVDSKLFANISEPLINGLISLRQSPSYMHGTFDLYNAGDLIAYSSIKSGNPGIFMIINPTEIRTVGNFSQYELPDRMTVDLLSDNYNITEAAPKGKIDTDKIPMSPRSAAVLTYVPVK